jgi:cell wall-associated NlpC family hydrolase
MGLMACEMHKAQPTVPDTGPLRTQQQVSPVALDTTLKLPVADTLLRERLVVFAESLIGTPYQYACSDPAKGFDCSGFISYVFSHFDIEVPRSSKDFTNMGTEIPLKDARRSDLILFTGTQPEVSREVGHMGIIVSNLKDSVSFIHSTSGKEYAVTITPLNDYYMKRFVKVIRILD